MKVKSCQKCIFFQTKFDDVTRCMEICMLPIEIINVVEEYFNNPNTYPEDLESDLYDIIRGGET